MSNVLVAYFSASGVTKRVAEKIAGENGYDIFEIVPEEIYTPADLDYMDKNSRSTIEMNDKSFRPPIKQTCDVSSYDTVAIGFPVWWYTAPTIINTFIESVDLKGKTIYTTGQGTTPEYTLNYILTKNGLKVGEDVTIEYKSEAAEVAALLSQDSSAVGMLPQPYATAVITKNPSMKIVLDMGEEWNKVSNTPVVTGVVIARNNVIDRNESGFEAFLEDYSNSVEYAKSNVEDVAAILADKGIFESAIATKAIPYMNIAFITGEQMQVNVDTYLNVLYQANPKSVGGAVPDNKFYYFSEDLVG